MDVRRQIEAMVEEKRLLLEAQERLEKAQRTLRIAFALDLFALVQLLLALWIVSCG